MTKRQILYAALGFMVTMIVVMGGAVAVLILTKPDAKIIWTDAEKKAAEQVRKKGKWEGYEAAAIAKVKALKVTSPADPDEPRKGRKRRVEQAPKITLGELVESGWFEKTYGTGELDPSGWRARPAKEAWYFVSYDRMDGLIHVGPVWLVHVGDGRILAKNTLARAGMQPGLADTKKMLARERQVVGAIANHRFESGVTLGGVILIHFSRLASRSNEDRIMGWTITHDYGDTYRAHFQWQESGAPTYADFEFKLDEKALRSRNLQAGNLMNIGRDFERTERVNIMPASYNPEAQRPKDRWIGKARTACAASANASRCRALARILQNKALIGSLEWLLTTEAGGAGTFSQCKQERRCKWTPRAKGNGVFEVEYSYDLEEVKADGKATWEIDMRNNKIRPQNKLAGMAFLAVNPRP